MIASDRTAVRVGSSLLVVDGTDETFNRKAEISIQPGRVKGKKLQEGPIALSREVYNAGLEERRGRWKWNQESVSVIDQFNEIPGLRELRPEIETFGSQLVRGALRLADDGRWLLHGHVHEKWLLRGRMVNVGVDAWAGRPVEEATLAALIAGGPCDLPPLPWD